MFTRLYRAEHDPLKQMKTVKTKQQMDWLKYVKIMHDQDGTNEAKGRWFTDDPDELDFYISDKDPAKVRIVYTDFPTQEIEKHRLSNIANTKELVNPKQYSRNQNKEFFLPKGIQTTQIPLSNQTLYDIEKGKIKVSDVI